MKFFVSILLIAIASFVASLFMPWWVVAIVAFVVSFFIPQNNSNAFFAGFIALFLLWVGLSFYLSNANNHLLTHKISMLVLQKDSVPFIIIATGIVGGLVAGFGSLSGSMLKKLLAKN